MKRRLLKKQVNYIAGELFAECVVLANVVPGVDVQKVDELMVAILHMQDEFISRISHTQPGNVKGFYKAFRTDFQAQVDALIDQISNLH
ncbi:MAG: hypothetical protein IKY31_00050 [Bacteroidaceae bacterium]|nr:hypothetical protein [Bacteroidaceae bacterium]